MRPLSVSDLVVLRGCSGVRQHQCPAARRARGAQVCLFNVDAGRLGRLWVVVDWVGAVVVGEA